MKKLITLALMAGSLFSVDLIYMDFSPYTNVRYKDAKVPMEKSVTVTGGQSGWVVIPNDRHSISVELRMDGGNVAISTNHGQVEITGTLLTNLHNMTNGYPWSAGGVSSNYITSLNTFATAVCARAVSNTVTMIVRVSRR